MSEGVQGRIYDGSVLVYLNNGQRWNLGSHSKAEVTIYPGQEPRYTEAEWREKQREQRPDAEVIERAREWLSQGLRAEDPEVHCGEQLTEARILVDDLLCYAMFGPQEADTLKRLFPYLRADEVLTREDAWQELRDAITEAAQAHGVRQSDIRLRLTDNATDFSVTSESSEGVACNPDPAEAVRMYAALAKPKRKRVEDMSEGELRDEIYDCDDAFVGWRQRDNGRWQMALLMGDDLVAVGHYTTQIEGYCAALRALREHQEREE